MKTNKSDILDGDQYLRRYNPSKDKEIFKHKFYVPGNISSYSCQQISKEYGYDNIRFEWDDYGHDDGAELINIYFKEESDIVMFILTKI